jgi:hypothetical protein
MALKIAYQSIKTYLSLPLYVACVGYYYTFVCISMGLEIVYLSIKTYLINSPFYLDMLHVYDTLIHCFVYLNGITDCISIYKTYLILPLYLRMLHVYDTLIFWFLGSWHMRYMSHDFLPVHIRLRLENVLSIPVTFSNRILPVSHLIKLLSRCCLLQIVTPHKLEVTAREK